MFALSVSATFIAYQLRCHDRRNRWRPTVRDEIVQAWQESDDTLFIYVPVSGSWMVATPHSLNGFPA